MVPKLLLILLLQEEILRYFSHQSKNTREILSFAFYNSRLSITHNQILHHNYSSSFIFLTKDIGSLFPHNLYRRYTTLPKVVLLLTYNFVKSYSPFNIQLCQCLLSFFLLPGPLNNFYPTYLTRVHFPIILVHSSLVNPLILGPLATSTPIRCSISSTFLGLIHRSEVHLSEAIPYNFVKSHLTYNLDTTCVTIVCLTYTESTDYTLILYPDSTGCSTILQPL